MFLCLADLELRLHSECSGEGAPGTLQQPSRREVKSSLKILSAQREDRVLGASSSAERQEGRLRSRAISLHGFRDELSKLVVLPHQDHKQAVFLLRAGTPLAVGSFLFDKAGFGTALQISTMAAKKPSRFALLIRVT